MQDLLLLHGAIGSSVQLKDLQSKLSGSFNVHVFDFPGHGGKRLPGSFSINVFAASVIDYLKEKQLGSVNIFGYSMGGYVAMYLARFHSALVNKVATLATKFEWTEEIATKEMKMLQPGIIEQKVPAFAEVLKQRHSPQDWKIVLNKTTEMLQQMGKDNPLKHPDYSAVHHDCLVMLGDKDKMVTREETEAVVRSLPNAELKILAETQHPIEQVNTVILAEQLINFFKKQ